MMSLLAIPGMAFRVLLTLCLFFLMRPGGWVIACFIAVAATWYIKI